MNKAEEMIYNDIIMMIKDNLRTLIYNRDSCLYRFTKYYNNMYNMAEKKKITLDQDLLAAFTEEALYALLNANFLYDYKDIE